MAETLRVEMWLGDCLDVMPTLRKKDVGFICADLPYNITGLGWDIAIDQKSMWQAMWHCLRENIAAVFTCDLRLSHKIMQNSPIPFAYDLIYLKTQGTGFMNARRAPLRAHELVLYFAKGLRTYTPQMFTPAVQVQAAKGKQQKNLPIYGAKYLSEEWRDTGKRYPISVLTPALPKAERGCHPTQKPVDLVAWLIKSYTNFEDTVLDPCAGSFTTSVAALRTGRNSICIEKDPGYFAAGVDRVKAEIAASGANVDLVVHG